MKCFRNLRTAVFFSFAGMLLMVWVSIVFAQEADESKVKAAFVYNFTKFIQWPNSTLPPGETKMSLCVLGNDHLGDALESLTGKIVSGRQLSVKRIKGPDDAGRCQILYICGSESNNARNILKGMKEGILTIGEMNQFASFGGIINFSVTENRVSFEINTDAAERAGLKISSQLLKLAKIVRDGSR